MREGTLASLGAGPPLWPSAPAEQAPRTDTSRPSKGDLPECPPVVLAGAGPEPRGQWPGLVVIVICSLWASASLALASSTSHQRGLFSVPLTWTLAGLPPGDFSSSSPMQNDMDRSQEAQGLAVGADPQHPEVPTGKSSVTAPSSLSHVIPEDSEEKGASWRATDGQKKALFPFLVSRLSSLRFRSRLPTQVKTLHANVAPSLKPHTEILAVGPPKDHVEKSLAQVDQMDNFLTTELPPSSQTPAIDPLGMVGSPESGVLQDGDRTELGQPSLSTESTPPAPTSEVQPSMKADSRVLSIPEYEVSFALSSSKDSLMSKGTYPSPEPTEAAETRNLPGEARKAIGATSFPSLGASWDRETQSHGPKFSRSSLSPHSSERNPREEVTSTRAIPAISSWPIRSTLYSRGPKKVASASKDSFPINSLNPNWISAIPPPTRPPEHPPRVIGPDLEFLATRRENEGYSQMSGHRRLAGSIDSILQHNIPIERYRLLSRPTTSPGVFESTTTDMGVSSDLGLLLFLPPRAPDAIKLKQGLSPVPTPKDRSIFALENGISQSATFTSLFPRVPRTELSSMAPQSEVALKPTVRMVCGGSPSPVPGMSSRNPTGHSELVTKEMKSPDLDTGITTTLSSEPLVTISSNPWDISVSLRQDRDSSKIPAETLRATSELPQTEPGVAGKTLGITDTRETSPMLLPTNVSLYGSTRHPVAQNSSGLDPLIGSASSQALPHFFTDAPFPSGMPQDSGWTAEPKTFVSGPSLAPFTETSLKAIPGASARSQTKQVLVSSAATEASRKSLNQTSRQASSLAPILQNQHSPQATTMLFHHSENSTLARSGNLTSLEPGATREGTELQTRPFPVHATSPMSKAGGGRTKPSPFLSSLLPAQPRTRATEASSQPVIAGSSKMPEEQLENVSALKSGSVSLFLPEPQAPLTTWTNTLTSEQDKSQTSPTKGQKRLPWTPDTGSRSARETLTHVTRQLDRDPSPSSPTSEPLEGLTSPTLGPPHPASDRRDTFGPSLPGIREDIFFEREPVKKVSVTPLDVDTPKASSPSRLALTASSLGKAAFLTFSLSTKPLVSSPLNAPEPVTPAVTWASHGSTAHPDTRKYGWSRTNPSLDQLPPKVTSPRQIFLARTKSSGSRRVLTINPQSISGREDVPDFLTSGVGSPSLELPTSTPKLQKIPVWRGGDSLLGSGFLAHRIPLQFHLSQISYHPLLADKHSAHFKRLQWEVTLIFRRMLSHMNGFQEISILHFFNGSVFVQSEVKVEGDPVPTSSDLIRSVVSTVRQKMDTYFSWRVNLTSLNSNGYGIGNLEPEKLPITFKVPAFGSLADGEDYQHLLDNLKVQVIRDLGKLYPVGKFSVLDVREIQGKLLVRSEVYVHSQAWADVRHVLHALTGLANQSVDLSSLSVAGSHLDLQFLPISFLVTNRKFRKSLWEPSCPEHRTVFRELSMAVTHALSRHGNLLQVIIQGCSNDSFRCVGELWFEAPKPTPQSLLHTLLTSVDSEGHLAGSEFQVDPNSFCIAEENLELSLGFKNISPISAVAIILCLLCFFTGLLMIIQCIRLRWMGGCWHRGTFSLQVNLTPREMFELSPFEHSGQQDENPTEGTDNPVFEGTSMEDFGSSRKETPILIHSHTRTP